MRIVLDMQGAQTESRFRGIGRYTISMAKALLSIKSEHQIFLAFNASMPEAIVDVREQLGDLIQEKNILTWYGLGRVQNDDMRNTWRRRATEECFKTFLQEVQTDLLFISSYFESFNEHAVTCIAEPEYGYATCVVIYDLIPWLNQEQYFINPIYAADYTRKFNEIQRASAALTISEYSRQEALAQLSFHADQVVNTYLGAESRFRPRVIDSTKRQRIMQAFKLDRPFLLYAGGSDERKNLPRLIKAFSALPKSMRQSYQLLLAGKFSVADQEHLQRLTRAYGMNSASVCYTGYISDDMLIDLYNLCTLFVFPSWHEGFGLPVLEAMACGAPAIAAHCSSLPEVLADPAAMFDPLDTDDISRKIAEILGDEELRQRLIERGAQHVKSFSWEKSAAIAMTKFEQMLNQQPRRDLITGSEFIHASRTHYLQLVRRIADLSASLKHANEQDLMGLARCIDRNQNEAHRVCAMVDLPNQCTWHLEPSLLSALGPGLASLGQHVTAQHHLHPQSPHALQHHEADVLVCTLPDTDQVPLPNQVLISYGLHLSNTVVPEKWVTDLNRFVRGILVSSYFLRKLLIDAGVYVPIAVEAENVSAWTDLLPARDLCSIKQNYCFVCEVSDIERDGLDIVLSAYGQSFSSTDQVSLFVLVEPAVADAVHAYIDHWQACSLSRADIVTVNASDEAIRKAIFLQSDCVIAPGRFQNVGSTVSRAVALGLPIIATGWGAQVSRETESETELRSVIHRIDYKFVRCLKDPSLLNDYWAEPDQKQLASLMLEEFSIGRSCQVSGVAPTSKETTSATANSAAMTLNQLARHWSSGPILRPLRIGWITTWNVRCGIASYSEHLTECIPDDVVILAPRRAQKLRLDCDNVVRCWDHTDLHLEDLNTAIKSHGIDTLVIQFNYGFFEFAAISEFLNIQAARGVRVTMMMHSTVDPINDTNRRLSLIAPALRTCHRILVHSVNDMNRLKQIGLIDNVTLFPHGIQEISPQETRMTSCPTPGANGDQVILASYGFCLPHKGLLELIDAVALLRAKGQNVSLNMINAEYPISESQGLAEQARLKIAALGLTQHVKLTTDFLSDEQSLALLRQSDIVVYPYQESGESASGAVRFGLAAMKPVAVTPLAIFDDVSQAVYKLPGFSAERIADGLGGLIESLRLKTDETAATLETAKAWCLAHQFPTLTVRLLGILKAQT